MFSRSCLLCALVLAVVGCHSMSDKDHEGKADDEGTSVITIDYGKAPAAVQTKFAATYPGAVVRKVEKETYANGTIHYEIDYTTVDGKSADVELDANGEILSH